MDIFVGIIVFGAVIGIFYVIKAAKDAAAAHEQDLISRYGPEIAALILAKKIQQGMTAEQVRESWGTPADIDQDVLKTKVKETWKYTQTGKNRFANRVFFENGMVIGWKESH